LGTNTGTRIGGYFGFGSTAVPTAAGVAALMADNGTDASNILTLKDNATVVGQMVDGGGFMVRYNVEPVTSTKSPGADESREVYTNEGDGDGATVTLPTAAAGLSYNVCVQVAQTLTITAASGDTIRIAGNVTAAAGSITSAVVGSCVSLVAINATEWFALSAVGSWTF
jgi:hypothetical protein